MPGKPEARWAEADDFMVIAAKLGIDPRAVVGAVADKGRLIVLYTEGAKGYAAVFENKQSLKLIKDRVEVPDLWDSLLDTANALKEKFNDDAQS